jgi:hypothetical protein
MNTSDSDTVRLQASKDIMDRGGFKPKDTMVIEEDSKSIQELEAEEPKKKRTKSRKSPFQQLKTRKPASISTDG